MNKVFVVQRQMVWDSESGELKPKFNLDPAKKYGELSFLLSPTAGPFNTKSIISELREKLAGYKSTDYLLLVGNPCLIGWAVAIAAHQTGGIIRLLQWSGKDGEYVGILANIFS